MEIKLILKLTKEETDNCLPPKKLKKLVSNNDYELISEIIFNSDLIYKAEIVNIDIERD